MSKITILVAVTTLISALLVAAPVAYVRGVLLFDNHAPTAITDTYTLHGNGTIGSVLANDSDPDPVNTIFPSLVTGPTNGGLTYVGNGNFYYSRYSSTWTGTDSFTYKACDNQSPSLCSSVVTVSITVANQAPAAVNDTYSIHGVT